MITCKYCLEIWKTNKQYYKLSKGSFIKQRVYYHIILYRVSKFLHLFSHMTQISFRKCMKV